MSTPFSADEKKLFREYIELSAQMTVLKRRKEKLSEEIKAVMSEGDKVTATGGTISLLWRKYTSWRDIATDLGATARPDLIEKHSEDLLVLNFSPRNKVARKPRCKQ